MANKPIQRQYEIHQRRGLAGQLARPHDPNVFHTGRLGVSGANGVARPGYGVFYDRSDNVYKVPSSAAEESQVIGMVSYDQQVNQTSATFPTDSNSDTFIEYQNNDLIKVAVMGTFYAIANAVLEYGDLVKFDEADLKWDVVSSVKDVANPANIAGVMDIIRALHSVNIVCVNQQPVSADGLAELRIGGWRSF